MTRRTQLLSTLICALLLVGGDARARGVSDLRAGDTLEVRRVAGHYQTSVHELTFRRGADRRIVVEITKHPAPLRVGDGTFHLPGTDAAQSSSSTLELSETDLSGLDSSLARHRDRDSFPECNGAPSEITLAWNTDGVVTRTEQFEQDLWCPPDPDGSPLNFHQLIRRTEPCVNAEGRKFLESRGSIAFAGRVERSRTETAFFDWIESWVEATAGGGKSNRGITVGVVDFAVRKAYIGKPGKQISLRTESDRLLEPGDEYFVLALEREDGELWISEIDADCLTDPPASPHPD